MKFNFTCFFLFCNVASGRFKIIYVAYIVFLLDDMDMGVYLPELMKPCKVENYRAARI